MKKKFTVEGMSCSACSAAVERVVSRLDGVDSVTVDLLGKAMICELDGSRATTEAIVKAVSKAGFVAIEHIDGKKEIKPEIKEEDTFTPVKTRLIISFVFLALLMYVSMGHMLSLPEPPFFKGSEMALVFAFTQLLLTLPVIYVNRKFFYVGFKALKNGVPNMDTLVALGSLAGVVYGIFAIYMIGAGLGTGNIIAVDTYRRNLYFESSAMILTLVTLGKFFEERSKSKTGDALRGLEKLCPETVNVERDGRELQIPTESVAVGDIVVLRPGSRVAVDGIIIEGSGSFDMSGLTGESVPVYKKEGDEILSASLLTDSFVKFRVTSAGSDTTLSKIIALVENAAATKAPVARLADKISRIFVPAVMALSLITLIVWIAIGSSFDFALSRALSVLVISCPCALGLATPVAITVSVGRLAGEGILVKNASWAELASGIKTMIFDKTGTLTTGKMQVCEIVSNDEETLLSVAKSLESYSEHPLAKAISEYAGDAKCLDITDFRAVSGRGVKGILGKDRLYGGNLAFMEENKIDISKYKVSADRLLADGKTVMYFAKGGRALGVIAISDTVKEGSAEAVAGLKKLGIKTVLLTGDNSLTAESVAKSIGIDEVIAEVMPADKEKYVREYSKAGGVAMVGDGVNDSPALAAANVGISMGKGTDIAIDASDIVLMSDDIAKTLRVVTYARTTLGIMKQNLFWAFIYNVLGIPLAMGVLASLGVLLNPMIGSAAMSFSSVFVVTNALRLLKK